MPLPVNISVPGVQGVVYAKDQPQYQPLPALRNGTAPECPVTSRWRLTQEDLEALASGADLYLTLWTYGAPLQPIRLQLLREEEVEEVLRRQGAIPEREG